MKAILAGIVGLAICACEFSTNTWLTVDAGGIHDDAIRDVEWPWDSGEFVRVNNSLADSAGLAGLVVEIYAPGESPIVLAADTFATAFGHEVGPFSLMAEGTVQLFAQLYQAGEIVAEGSLSWDAAPIFNGWHVYVERGPYSPGVDPRGPICNVPFCNTVRRVDIRQDFRNYPAEALWLTLWDG